MFRRYFNIVARMCFVATLKVLVIIMFGCNFESEARIYLATNLKVRLEYVWSLL